MFSPLPPAVGLVHDSKVRALGVTGARRSPLLPDLPTIAESGLPGYECELHYGIVAPAGVPRPIVDKLGAALRAALAVPEVAQRLATDGAEVFASTPEPTRPTSRPRRQSGRRSCARPAPWPNETEQGGEP